jgi:hypothetical protein
MFSRIYTFSFSTGGELYFGCVASVFCGIWNYLLEETEGVLKILLSPTSAGRQLVQFIALFYLQCLSSRQFAGHEFCMR